MYGKRRLTSSGGSRSSGTLSAYFSGTQTRLELDAPTNHHLPLPIGCHGASAART